MQLGRSRLDTRRKKYYSMGSAVVEKVTQRESGSVQGFVFQGTAREDREISVNEGRCSGESKVG